MTVTFLVTVTNPLVKDKIMRVCFSLAWLKAGQPVPKAFKEPSAFCLFQEYVERISRFAPCEAGGAQKAKATVWVCEREKGSKALSSEALARELQKCLNSGAQELQIVIGGPDGFTAEELETMKPSLRWSFGPMTLPHELATVVAAEQIYRAFAILNHLPYHAGH